MSVPKPPDDSTLPEVTRDLPVHRIQPHTMPFTRDRQEEAGPRTERQPPTFSAPVPQQPAPQSHQAPQPQHAQPQHAPPQHAPPQHAPPQHAPPLHAPPILKPLNTTLMGGGMGRSIPQQPPVATHHAPEAAVAGVAAASLAASGAERRSEAGRHHPASRPRTRRDTVLVDVLWHATSAPRRVRQHPEWASYAVAESSSAWITDGAASTQAKDDPRDIARALARIPPLDGIGIARSLHDAIDDEGVFDRPVLVVEGELELRFDPQAVLAAMAAAARPFANGDKRLESAVFAATEATRDDTRVLPTAIEALRRQLVSAFETAARSMPSDYLLDASQRTLLEDHRYASHTVLGGRHFCAHLKPRSGAPVATYLPEAVASMLPLLRTFDVRLVAEPHAKLDPNEIGDIALSVLALARISQLS